MEKCNYCNVELDEGGDPCADWDMLVDEEVYGKTFVSLTGLSILNPVDLGFRLGVEIFRSNRTDWVLSIDLLNDYDDDPLKFADPGDDSKLRDDIVFTVPIRFCPMCGRRLPRP